MAVIRYTATLVQNVSMLNSLFVRKLLVESYSELQLTLQYGEKPDSQSISICRVGNEETQKSIQNESTLLTVS